MAIIFPQGYSVLKCRLVAYWFTVLPGGERGGAPLLQWQFYQAVMTSASSCIISCHKFFYLPEDPMDWMHLPSVQRVEAVESSSVHIVEAVQFQRGVWKRLVGLGSAFWK